MSVRPRLYLRPRQSMSIKPFASSNMARRIICRALRHVGARRGAAASHEWPAFVRGQEELARSDHGLRGHGRAKRRLERLASSTVSALIVGEPGWQGSCSAVHPIIFRLARVSRSSPCDAAVLPVTTGKDCCLERCSVPAPTEPNCIPEAWSRPVTARSFSTRSASCRRPFRASDSGDG